MKLIELEKKYEGKFLTYYVATYLNKENQIKKYEFISRDKNLTVDTFKAHTPQGVGMVTYSLDKQKMLIQKEYRLACNEWVYNFPAGLIDEGEDALSAAKRELKEETGVELVEVEAILPPSYASQGTSDEMMTIVIGKCKGEIINSSFANEEIEAMWISKKEALELIENKALMSVRTQMFLYQWASEK